jgi:hypothetical protein
MITAGFAQPTIPTIERRNTMNTATTATATVCAICREPTLSGQSSHGQCGGYLPASPKESTWACAHHVEKLLSRKYGSGKAKRRRPWTLTQIRSQLRLEYRGRVLDWALEALHQAGKVTYAGERIALTPAKRGLPQRDNATAAGLFELPI